MDEKGKTGRRYSAVEKAAVIRMARTLRPELGTERGTETIVEGSRAYDDVQLTCGPQRKFTVVNRFFPLVSQSDQAKLSEWPSC